MKLLKIPKFIFRILRYISLELIRGYSLACLMLVFLVARNHKFYRKIGFYLRLNLWKLSGGGL